MKVDILKKYQEVNLSFDDHKIRVYKDGYNVLSDGFGIVDYGPYGQGFGLRIETSHGSLADWYYCWRDAGGELKLLGKRYWLEADFGPNEDVYKVQDNKHELFSAKISKEQFQYKYMIELPTEELKLILVLVSAIKIRDEKKLMA